jgi:hypothetical protein
MNLGYRLLFQQTCKSFILGTFSLCSELGGVHRCGNDGKSGKIPLRNIILLRSQRVPRRFRSCRVAVAATRAVAMPHPHRIFPVQLSRRGHASDIQPPLTSHERVPQTPVGRVNAASRSLAMYMRGSSSQVDAFVYSPGIFSSLSSKIMDGSSYLVSSGGQNKSRVNFSGPAESSMGRPMLDPRLMPTGLPSLLRLWTGLLGRPWWTRLVALLQ